MGTAQLADLLIAVLQKSPDQTAAELVDILRLAGVQTNRTDVNATLYGHDQVFKCAGESKPRWRTLPGVSTSVDLWDRDSHTTTTPAEVRASGAPVTDEELLGLLGY